MPTRSIQLSDDEAQGLQRLHDATGEAEDALLERAVLRGLQELRLEAGIQAFKDGRGSSEGAAIAGVPRVVFLEMLADRGVKILDGPSTLATDLADMAQWLGNERLAEAARKLADSKK
jgi:predicted HTH domain antitoxin